MSGVCVHVLWVGWRRVIGAALTRRAAAECLRQWLTSIRGPPTSLIHVFLTSDHHRGSIVRLGIASTHGREKGLKPESLAHTAVSLQISPAFGQQFPNRCKNSSSKTGNYLQERHSQPPPMSILAFLLSNRPRTLAWAICLLCG